MPRGVYDRSKVRRKRIQRNVLVINQAGTSRPKKKGKRVKKDRAAELAMREARRVSRELKKRLSEPFGSFEPEKGLQLSIQIDEHIAEVKIRNGQMLGTLLIDGEGLVFKRPNQKGKADRKITYATLSKLMALGLVQ